MKLVSEKVEAQQSCCRNDRKTGKKRLVSFIKLGFVSGRGTGVHRKN